MDYSKYINDVSKARKPSAIRDLVHVAMRNKQIISLGAGDPNPATFPFASMTLTLKTREQIVVDDILFKRSLGYDFTAGQPKLNEWLRELQSIEHHPPVEFDLSIGSGSQDLLTKALEMLIRPGDAVLAESPTYTGALSVLENLDCTIADIPTDAHGIIPHHLDEMLRTWPQNNPSGLTNQPRPHCLYTVPSGGNPTGVSSTLERKQAIYAICSKYDVIIVEDDPYYFLQFSKTRIPSYLSMDTEGRVLRLDSMSKVLAAGLRLGWVTGPKVLVERINLHTMGTNLQPAGISQGMAYSLLEKWGHTGFLEHVDRVSDFYKEKRDEMVECLERYMVGRGEWAVPDAGMFVWIKLLGGVTDAFDLVLNKLLKENVLVVPGLAFMPQQNKSEYVRISYSNINKENMGIALKTLAEVIDKEAASMNGVKV